MSKQSALRIVGAAVALGIAACGGSTQSQGHRNLHAVSRQTDCGAGILVTVNGIENSTETYPAINCKTAVAVGTALAAAKHIDTSGLRVDGYSWDCYADDSLKDDRDAVCETNRDLLVARIRIMNIGTYLPAQIARPKPEPPPVVQNTATSTTTTPIPKYVNGGQVDQSNPRPPCPSTDVVSSATGDVYCLIASQPAPPSTETTTATTTETTTTATATTPTSSSSSTSSPTGGVTGNCPPSDGGPGKCAGIPAGQPCC